MLKTCIVFICFSPFFIIGCGKEETKFEIVDAKDAKTTASDSAPKAMEDTAESPAAGLIEIAFDIPSSMFIGTPEDIDVENLQSLPTGKRAPFMAPAGTKNLALGKLVTVLDDEEPISGDLPMITDGDKETGDGSVVGIGIFEQYITIDLGAEHKIYALLLWHYHMQGRVYNDVVVELSTDVNFKENVHIIFHTDHDDSLDPGHGIGKDMNYIDTNEGKLLDGKGHSARYIRCHSNGNNTNDTNHYIEVEAWGI